MDTPITVHSEFVNLLNFREMSLVFSQKDGVFLSPMGKVHSLSAEGG